MWARSTELHRHYWRSQLVGSGGFEPPKLAHLIYSQAQLSTLATALAPGPTCTGWSRRWDSNPQPAVYKTAALPIELRRQTRHDQLLRRPPVYERLITQSTRQRSCRPISRGRRSRAIANLRHLNYYSHMFGGTLQGGWSCHARPDNFRLQRSTNRSAKRA